MDDQEQRGGGRRRLPSDRETGGSAPQPLGGSPFRLQRNRRRERQPLDRDRIVAAALAIADEDGLEAVSMRNVAGRLGVGTMTLYGHIDGREELLELMDDAVTGEVLIPDDELPAGWREALHAIALRTYRTARRHTWRTRATNRRGFGPNSLRHAEQSARAVAGAGLPPRQSLILVNAIDAFVFGHAARVAAMEELRRQQAMSEAEWREELERFMDEILEGDEFPGLRLWKDAVLDVGEDEVFEQGLTWLFDGVMASIEKARPGESA